MSCGPSKLVSSKVTVQPSAASLLLQLWPAMTLVPSTQMPRSSVLALNAQVTCTSSMHRAYGVVVVQVVVEVLVEVEVLAVASVVCSVVASVVAAVVASVVLSVVTSVVVEAVVATAVVVGHANGTILRKYAYLRHPAAHILFHVRPGRLHATQVNADVDGTEGDHVPANAFSV